MRAFAGGALPTVHTSCTQGPDAGIRGLIKFREELSPVCLREGKVSSLNLIFGHHSEQVGNMDLDSSPTDSEGLEGDQGDALILTCNSHLSESDRCEFK